MRTSRTFVGLIFTLSMSLCWAKPNSFQQNYIEIEVTDYPQEIIDENSEIVIKGHACLKKHKGKKEGCEKFSPQDLSLFDFEFTYPNESNDVSQFVRLIEKKDRFEFEAVLPRIDANHEQATFSARITEKGKKKKGIHIAIEKLRAHIVRLEQMKDKLPSKGKNSFDKLHRNLKSVEAKLLKKIRSVDSRWSERNIAFQVKNYIASESSWMVSTDTWDVTATFPLGIGFEGETTWLDVYFQSYREEGDEWKIQVYDKDVLLKEDVRTGLNFSQRVLIPSSSVGDNPVTIKVLGRNTSKKRPVFEEIITREVKLPRIKDSTSPHYLSLIPSPGRYVGREIPEFRLSLQDGLGRMDRSTVDGVLIEDGGNKVSLKNFLSFETSQSTLVDYIHGNQNGSDFFTFFGSPLGVPEGFYNLQILTKDFAGNHAAETQWRFIVDRTAPSIAIPTVPSIRSNDESYELPISVFDATDVSIQVFNNGVFQGETTEKEGDSIGVDLVDGPNMVKITAIDEAGNYSEINYPPIFLDFTPPAINNINLESGQLIRTASYIIEGNAHEDLAAVIINGQEVDFDQGRSFSYPINLYTEGEQFITVEMIDLAGNSSVFEYRIDFLLRLVDGALIRVEKIDEDYMKIIGHAGATGPGFPLEIDGGFLNSKEITANEDGSFEVLLDAFDEAVVTATYPVNGRQESALAKFKFDTTLAGLVKDSDNNPLPNVTVSILSSGQTTVTDVTGRFYISDPAQGDQTLLIDGSTIPEEVTLGKKEFSRISYNVSLGSRQQNILERPIYLIPKILDGSETIISNGSAVIVSTPHAPGVTIDIPQGAVIFPGGSNSGSINIMEVSGDRIPIELPDEVSPKTLYALEPSGLKFRERVHLTLPNPNEFPEGTELVIVSRNSETGFWEIDGSATVTGPDTIETKPGQGISHFSELFASPFGMEVKKFADGDKPRIDTLDGGVSTQVQLPSFKILGQDITPSLVYNSNWANPNVLISNVFDIPRKKYDVRRKDLISKWGVVESDIRIETWVTPEWIDAEFVAGEYQSEKMRFTGLPDRAVVSSIHNLSGLKSGIIPSKASYEIAFRELTIQSGKMKVRSDMGGTQTVKLKPQTTVEWHQVFPPDLQAPIYLQNKTDASEGAGWKLSLAKTILNPQSDRILVENESGGLAVYAVNNDVQELAYDESGIEAIGVEGDDVYFVTGSNNLSKYADGSLRVIDQLPRYSGSIGVNDSWYHGSSSRCVKSGFYGCKKREYTYRYSCNKYEAPFDVGRNAKSLSVQNGEVHLLDNLGAIFRESESWPMAGAMGLPANYIQATNASRGSSVMPHCNNTIGGNCSDQKIGNNTYVVAIKSRPSNAKGYCNTASCYSGNCSPRTWLTGSGAVPQIGFADGPLSISKFNKPFDFSPGNREGTYYVADFGNNRVRFVDLAVGNTVTVAGNGATTDLGNGGLATNASIFHPRGVVVDRDGSYYISSERGYIRKVTPDGRINAFAGKPTTAGGVLADLTRFEDLALKNPSAMVIDHQRDILYVADTGHNRVVALDLKTSMAKAVAGNGSCTPGDTLAGKVALAVSFCAPEKIALDSQGNLIILDQVNKRVRRVNFSTPQDGLIQYRPLAKDNSVLFRNAEGEFLLSSRDGRQEVFNKKGLQIETSDRAGRLYEFFYNDDDQLTVVKFPTGQEMLLDYSGDKLSQIIDPAGRVTQFVAGSGFLERVVFPDGSQRQFFYEENGILVEEKNQLGYSTHYNLNQFKRLQSIQLADNSLIQISDALSQTVHEGELSGVQELKSFKSGENPLADVIRNAKGVETTFSRDTNGYLDIITDFEGKQTHVERDLEGRPIKITKYDGDYTRFTYHADTGDLLSRYESATDTSESFVYNEWGQLLQHTSPIGKITQKQYDENTGLLLKEIDHRGVFIQRSYGQLGLMTSITNNLGQIQNYGYDSFGNLVQVVSPMGEVTNYNRDEAGNVISKINPKNEITTYSFDPFNRLQSVTTPRNEVTSYTYLPTGQLSEIIAPNNNITTFEYNSMGRLSRKISPKGQVTQLAYDQNGNVIQEIDPKGQVKTFEYNLSDQLVRKVLPDNEYTYSYTESGKPLRISSNNSSFIYSYAKIHGEEYLTGIHQEVEDIPTNDLGYFYNADGKLLGMDSDFISLDYLYNDSGKLHGVQNSLGQSFNFSYDNSNRLIAMDLGGVISTQNIFDGNSFLSEIIHSRSGTVVSAFAYTRDANHNRSSMTTLYGTHNYQYDSEGQLTSASHPEGDALYALETFTYDVLGNRTADNQGSFVYDNNKFQLVEDWKYIYAYDLNGNLVTKQEKGLTGKVQNFIYTSENQLAQIDFIDNGNLVKQVHHSYDALGRRVKKRILENGQEKIRKYVYDSNEIIAELNESNDVLVRYTHSGLRTDDVLGMNVTSAGVSEGFAPNSGNYFFLKDGLGSITEITNSTGQVVQRYSYSSFGKIYKIDNGGVDKTTNPDIKSSFTYTNREYDSESGLYYYRARYYDPALGRFLTEDPHPGVLKNPLTFNSKYAYVLNNPFAYTDPEGEFVVELLVLTLIQTAIQSAMQNGSWWDNFKNSFNTPFSGNGGQFWENLLFNGISMGIGFNPGFDLTTASFLGFSAIGTDLEDQQKREGYKSNYLGFKVGQLNDGFKIYDFANKVYKVNAGIEELVKSFRIIPVFAGYGDFDG